jgi:hypothetical protein
MNSTTDFAKTIAARAGTRAQMLAFDGRMPRRDRLGASLERRIEGMMRAARSAGQLGGHSTLSTQVPKT